MRRWLMALAILLAMPASAEPVRVFAASSVTEAMNAVADAYAATGVARPTLVFAASSALARQIEAGAPAGVFLSADEDWMDYLAAKQLIVPASRRDLLGNTLVLVVPKDDKRNVRIGNNFDLAGFAGDGKWVTGDPDSVPVGKYAKAVLTNLGSWTAAEPKLARAENVRAALAFVERGDASAGIVYATDALASPKVRVAGVFPATSGPPIVYPVALVAANDNADARAFISFVEGPQARALFVKRGFITK